MKFWINAADGTYYHGTCKQAPVSSPSKVLIVAIFSTLIVLTVIGGGIYLIIRRKKQKHE